MFGKYSKSSMNTLKILVPNQRKNTKLFLGDLISHHGSFASHCLSQAHLRQRQTFHVLQTPASVTVGSTLPTEAQGNFPALPRTTWKPIFLPTDPHHFPLFPFILLHVDCQPPHPQLHNRLGFFFFFFENKTPVLCHTSALYYVQVRHSSHVSKKEERCFRTG